MKDISRFLSKTALTRAVSPIRAITSYLLSLPPEKDLVSLAGGMPAPTTFPLKAIDIELKTGAKLQIKGTEVASALNYGKTLGFDELVQFWREMMWDLIEPCPGIDRDVIVTTGAEFGSYMVLNALIDPGDSIMVPSPVYPPMMLKTQSMYANLVSVGEDPEIGGLCPKQLRAILNSWEPSKPKPKILIICPTGSNPSGGNVPNVHREEIYDIICEHDMLLLEDDPYYFLNYGEKLNSFLSYDTEGRVIRLDSLSKVLSPGLRLGFCTAPSQLVEVMERHQSVTVLGTSSMSQAIALSYLKHVGVSGFLQQACHIAEYYRSQRDAIIAALDTHMGDMATWIVPQAGMFVWVKLNDVEDSSVLVNPAMDNGVVFVPGNAFLEEGTRSSYIRLSFSMVSEDYVDEAVQRLATTVREHLDNKHNVGHGAIELPIFKFSGRELKE